MIGQRNGCKDPRKTKQSKCAFAFCSSFLPVIPTIHIPLLFSLTEWKRAICEICGGKVLNGERERQVHFKSRSHKKRLARMHKRKRNEEAQALYAKKKPREDAPEEEEEKEEEADDDEDETVQGGEGEASI